VATTSTAAPPAADEITFDIDTVPDEDRERVEALIPGAGVARSYVHRNVHGLYDFDLFDGAVEEQENVLLAGPTGSSKTTAFRAYAAERHVPFALVECHAAMDPGMTVGKSTTLGDGSFGWMDGDMTVVARYGGVILFDEVNMAIPRVMAAFKALISVTRRLTIPENTESIIAGHGAHGHHFEKDTDDDGNEVDVLVCEGEAQPVLIAAAYNPRYQGTARLNEALLNQFALPVDWGYERAVEAQLIDSTTLLDQADGMRSLADIRTPVSTNMLMEFERHYLRWGADAAVGFFKAHFEDGTERNAVNRALDAEIDKIVREIDAATS
jgi:MoxR-like ATPase